MRQHQFFPRPDDDRTPPPQWKVWLRKKFPVGLKRMSNFLSLGLGLDAITSGNKGNSADLRSNPWVITSSTVDPSSSSSFGFGSFCFSLAFSQSLCDRRSSRAKEISGGGISRSSAPTTNVLPVDLVGLSAIGRGTRTHSSPDSSSHQSMRSCSASAFAPFGHTRITGETKTFAGISITSPGFPCPPSGKSNTSTWPYRRSSSELGSSPYVFHCGKTVQRVTATANWNSLSGLRPR